MGSWYKMTESVDEEKAMGIIYLVNGKAFSIVSIRLPACKVGKRNMAGDSDCKGLMARALPGGHLYAEFPKGLSGNLPCLVP